MFYKKFAPSFTWGEGPNRLANLYFGYLFVLRAISKVCMSLFLSHTVCMFWLFRAYEADSL